MSIETGNEITVKLRCTTKELEDLLLSKGYKKTKHFTIDDFYYIPKTLNLGATPTRQILSKAILVRDVVNYTDNRNDKKMTYKIKEINDKGEIISQKSYNCDVIDVDSAKHFLEAIGYNFLMEIKEDDSELVGPDGFQIATKNITNGDDLIEIETNDIFDTIEKIIDRLEHEDVPYNNDNYFVKKAEIELEKILGKE
ncbi:hypothetical protein IJ096_01815 [Candidatus Saccharibacteria bacterium]|nr:hypothetical protein [Candidatus Saccharibacteria bacterium]